ncbi:MAG TPA: hypothetical protein VGI39_35550 [Polyangiaceae bacterium]|jgi:ABC-type polysaccharide/polyol phosphate export permease
MLPLITNELRRSWEETRRHWVDPLLGISVMSVLFFGFYYGVAAFAARKEPGDLDGIIIGYLCWGLASGSFQSVSATVTSEAQAGILEQLYLTPNRFRMIVLCRAIVSMLQNLASVVILALVAMAGTRRWLHVPLVPTLMLLLLGSVALMGLGLIGGGLALNNKRLSSLTGISMIGLFAVVSVPALPFGPLSFLPFSLASSAVRSLVIGGAPVNAQVYGAVAANSAVYLALGSLAFGWLERRAKCANRLGQH